MKLIPNPNLFKNIMTQNVNLQTTALKCLMLLLFVITLASCDGNKNSSIHQIKQNIVKNYVELAHLNYKDTYQSLGQLESRINLLIQEPSEDNLNGAKDAWLNSREYYLQTEVYRFYGGPIDSAEGYINAWPLDEAYIDYVRDNINTGIINDQEIEINQDLLINMNEAGGEENIATGYHAIEFLLWGQDFNINGPGNRPFTDYLDQDRNAQRRATYLTTATELLKEHLAFVNNQWLPDADNYRAEFISVSPDEGIKKILTGMIILSGFETGGERLQAAYDSADQEDEHSCFSDNTHRDMIQDIQGIKNVWHGNYSPMTGEKIDGPGIKDLASLIHPELGQSIEQRINASLLYANNLEIPFDQEISNTNPQGRERVLKLISSLRNLEQDLMLLMEHLKLEPLSTDVT